MLRITIFCVLLTLALPFMASDGTPRNADLLLTNGTIITMDEKNPLCDTAAVKGDRFIYATVVPGLIDAHGHLLGLGLHLERIDLTQTTSLEG